MSLHCVLYSSGNFYVHFRMTSLTCATPRALSECWLGFDVQILGVFISLY